MVFTKDITKAQTMLSLPSPLAPESHQESHMVRHAESSKNKSTESFSKEPVAKCRVV
jgi:hypothetical protein